MVDATCNTSGGSIPNVFVFELNSCNAGSAVPINGTVSLNADGDIATFTPTNPADMETNNCYGFVVSSCILDLAGNSLPSRGERSIGAYGGNSVTYNSYSVFFTGSGDSTAPSLVNVGPIINATNVHERIFAHMIFDEALDSATVTSTNFFATAGASSDPLPMAIQIDPTLQMVTFETPQSYALSSVIDLTANGNAADLAGNTMSGPQTSTMNTVSSADTTAPTIVSVSPADGSNINEKCPYVDIYFSEPMDTTTLNESNIQLIRVRTGRTKPTTLSISDDHMRVRLVPDSSLNHGNGNRNDWDISIDGSVADRAGNTLGTTTTFFFEANRESDAPDVSAIVPADGGSTSQNGSILVFFDEAMDKSTLTADNFTITGCTPIIFADEAGNWAIANCINQMTTGAKTLTVNREVRDFYHNNNNQSCEIGSGNRMAANVTSNFTVNSGDDTTAPTISNLSDVSPQDGTTSVSTAVAPSITFSEAIDPRTMIPSSVFLMSQEGQRISSTLSLSTDARTITITPTVALASPGIYYIVATTALRDLGGGNAYDGAGGESVAIDGILRTCFSTDGTACP